MSLDHGILNVPLTKRGNFHKELDAHLASEKRKKEDAFFLAKEAKRAAREQVLQMFSRIDKDMLKHEANKRNMKATELKRIVKDLCNDHPARAIKVMELLTVQI